MWSGARLGLITLAVLCATAPGLAQSPFHKPGSLGPGTSGAPADERVTPGRPRAGDSKAAVPTVRIGALLPLTGAAAWFGKEMRQGMELAIAELNRLSEPAAAAKPREGPGAGGDAKPAAAAPPLHDDGLTPPGVQLVLEALDVHALQLKDATEGFSRLAAGRLPVVFTASATPTVTVQPLAAARDVLLVHQGVVTARFPASSRTLLHTRATVAWRVERLAAYAWGRGIRRLALLAAGDEHGQAVRTVLGVAWRARGVALTYQESLTLDTPDLTARLRQLARLAPDAILLGFRGSDLGDLAARLRELGYRGLFLALEDDPAMVLAAGPALEDAVVVSDAFVPEPGSRGERFALAYAAKHKDLPSRYAANAYDAVVVVAEGLRAAMNTGRDVPSGARLREALAARRRFPSVYGGTLVLRDDGTFERPLALFVVEGGTLAFVRYIGAEPA